MKRFWTVVRKSRHRHLILKPRTEGTILAQTGAVDPGDGAAVESRTEGALQPRLIENMKPLEPNDNPLDRTISPAPPQHFMARLARLLRRIYQNRNMILLRAVTKPLVISSHLWHQRPWRTLTPEEVMQKQEMDRRRKMAALLMSESNLYWDRLVNALDRHGMKHKPAKGDDEAGAFRGTRHVKFNLVKLQPEAIYMRLATDTLPYGTTIPNLMDKDLLVDLSIACGRRVTAEYSDRIGAWYIIERAVGVRGIPDHVKYDDLFAAFPASADGLTVPIGIALNAKPIYRSLGRMYSMLIAGTIGSGKSNCVNGILTTLIKRNPPERLKLILVDLKGGLEFQFFEGIPHLIPIPDIAPNGIADQNEQVPGVLLWVHKEGERRMEILREAGYKSIGRYNAYQRNRRLPHIVLVIDEWADVMYNKAIKSECEEMLANVAQRFRAVGIHVIVCTQIPKAEVISTRIKGVLPAKMAFSVPTNASSMVILDNADARGLQPAGRCVFQWDDQYEIQTPFVNEEMVMAAVQQATTGQVDETGRRHDVTQLEILEYALAEDNGYLSRDHMFAVFGKRGLTKDELDSWLAEMEGQEFVLGTSLYKVDKAAGSRPRRLIAIDENADDIPDVES